MDPQFSRTPNPAPATKAQRDAIFADPGFGRHFSDHMVTVKWSAGAGWHDPAVVPFAPLQLSPAAMALHYGQTIFEGLKAYRQPDGSIASFRPDANASRFRGSAARMAMPELPDELFLTSLSELLAVDHEWVPAAGGDHSFYLRPFMLATEPGLGVRPAAEYLYILIGGPAGAYFPGGSIVPVDVWLTTDYTRAALGGTGTAKCGGNYAASLLPQAQAAEHGCAQVAYLDAVERTWIEEMGSNNMFFVFGSGEQAEVVTPSLTGTILSGIIRDSVLVLAKELGCQVTERRVSGQEVLEGVADGRITEIFGSGTAAVVAPIGGVKHAGGAVRVADGEPGEITMKVRGMLTSIQCGTAPDTHSWMRTLLPA